MNQTRCHRTRAILKSAAEDIFSRAGYESASVAEICRESGLSNGAFYRHFRSKRQVFEEITADMKESLEATLSDVKGDTLRERLLSFYGSIFETLWNNRKKFIAFHEAEYRFPDLEKAVERSYRKALARVLRISPDNLERYKKWFTIGSSRFTAIYWILFQGRRVPESTVNSLVDFVLKGLGARQKLDSDSVNYDATSEYNRDVPGTKDAILVAAERLMGARGYFKTSVYEIMSKAGFAQGTFYNYFESKQKLLEELVIWANRRFRRTLKDSSERIEGRLNKEVRNYKAFLLFMTVHRDLYEIVREAEFILDGVGQLYYEKILRSYVPALKESMEAGEIEQGNPEDLGLFLMGIGHFMGIDLVLREELPKEQWNEQLIELASLVSHGLEGDHHV